MPRPALELLVDFAGDGLRSAVTFTSEPAAVAGQYASFNSRPMRAADSARTQLAASALMPATALFGWIVACDFDSDATAIAADAVLLDLTEDASNWVRLYFDHSANVFTLEVRSGGTTESVSTSAQSWSAGAGIVLVCYATASALGIAESVNAAAISAFDTAARAQAAPTITTTTVDVGRLAAGGSYAEAAFAYVAALDAAPTVTVASQLAELTRPPLFGEPSAGLGRAMVALWYGKDGDYYDDERDQVTPELREFTTRYGRRGASSLTERASPGTLAAALRDLDARYAPRNSSSPLFGLNVAGRAVQLRMAYAGAHYDVWGGFLAAAVEPETGVRHTQRARLSAHGPLAELADAPGTIAAQASQDAGTIAGLVLNAAGWPAADRALDTGDSTFPVVFTKPDAKALAVLRELEDSELGFLRESKARGVVFERRSHRRTGVHLTSQQTFSTAAAATLSPFAVLPEDPARDLFNVAKIEVLDFTAPAATAVLWAYAGGPIELEPSASAVVVARWPLDDEPDGAYVDSWEDLVAGDVSMSAGAFGDLAIVHTKQARRMEIELTNSSGAPVTIDTIQAQGDAVSFNDPISVVKDQSSGARKLEYPLPAKWLGDVEAARDLAALVVSTHNPPPTLVTFGIQPMRNEASGVPAVLGLDLSDRITLTADDGRFTLGISAVEFYVESISHRYTRGRWETWLSASAADDVIPMVTGETALDGPAVFWL